MKARVGLFYIFLCGFIFLYIVPPSTMSKVYFFWVILAVAFCLLVYFTLPEEDIVLKGKSLKHSNVFIIGFVIVYFQYPIDFLLDYSPAHNIYIWKNQASAVRGLLLSSIGLLSMLVGYTLFSSSSKKIIYSSVSTKLTSNTFLKILSLFSLIAYFSHIDTNYVLGGYAKGGELNSMAKYLALLFEVSIYATIVNTSRNLLLKSTKPLTVIQYLNSLGFLSILLVVIYLLSVILSGDRGPIIYLSLSVLGGFLMVTKRKYSLLKIMVAIMLSASVMNILGIARNLDPDLGFKEKVSIVINHDSYLSKDSISPSTKELAGSVRTLNYAIDFVPESHGYTYGLFQFHDLLSTIPFLSGFYFSLYGENRDDMIRVYGSSAYFMTWVIQGDNPTYGDGSSLLADFYLSFGFIAIMVGMTFMGWFLRRLEYVMYSDNIVPLFWQVTSIVYFSQLIYVSRASFFQPFGVIGLTLIVLICNKLFTLDNFKLNI